mmetsp:Transcript_53748/g.149098  ORF Transcript_53748/g.149098 Transcript_53748/m.149098 type:complete len:85 (+) Transcript_53748:94-348(+)
MASGGQQSGSSRTGQVQACQGGDPPVAASSSSLQQAAVEFPPDIHPGSCTSQQAHIKSTRMRVSLAFHPQVDSKWRDLNNCPSK